MQAFRFIRFSSAVSEQPDHKDRGFGQTGGAGPAVPQSQRHQQNRGSGARGKCRFCAAE